MRRSFWILGWSATLAVPRVAAAQPSSDAILVGYGALAITAVGRVIRGNGQADVRDGSRVRLKLGIGTLEGAVVSSSSDSLVLETPAGRRALANTDVHDLQVSVGDRSRWAQGFLSGFAIGGLCGVGIAFAEGDDPPGAGWYSHTAQEKAVNFGVGLAFVGSFVGALAGQVTPREAWAHAREPIGGGSIAVAPVLGRRIGVAARLTF